MFDKFEQLGWDQMHSMQIQFRLEQMLIQLLEQVQVVTVVRL